MKMKTGKKNLSSLFGTRWAIRREAAETFASTGDWWGEFKDDGEVDQKNNVTRREDGIAVVHIDGPLSYRSEVWTAIFGMDTYDSIAAAVDECLEDPHVLGIVLDINSPGGEVNGVADLADKIFNARDSKPYGIVARTGGLMCSAAYWIGSSAEKVFSAPNGTIGSIGVLCSFYRGKSDKNVATIVSDLSPNKAPTPDTEEGLSQIKKELNDLAAVFISAVARNRATDFETVLTEYGQGGVFIGQKAVDAGLADGVASIDEICENMKSFKYKEATMAEKNSAPKAGKEEVDVEALKKQAVADYLKRAEDVKSVFAGLEADESLVKAFIDDETKTVADAEHEALAMAKKQIGAMQETHKAAIAAKDEEIAKAKKESGLSDEQKKAIQQGIEAGAAAQNSVQGGGISGEAGAERKRLSEAFSKGFKKN